MLKSRSLQNGNRMCIQEIIYATKMPFKCFFLFVINENFAYFLQCISEANMRYFLHCVVNTLTTVYSALQMHLWANWVATLKICK